MDVKELKNKINLINPEKARLFFARANRWLLLFVFLLFFGYCLFLWYSYVLNPALSGEEKAEYVNSKQAAVIFDKNKFNRAITEINSRRDDFGRPIENATDIFRLKPTR